MLRKFSLIGAVAVALFFPIPASAGSAFKGAATNPGGKTSPTAERRQVSTLIPVASTFIAVTAASFTLIPVRSTFIPVGQLNRLI